MHGGIAHIFGNMLFLWIFGDNVEDALGHLRYFLFYMTTGIIASLAHVLTTVAMYAGSEQAGAVAGAGGDLGCVGARTSICFRKLPGHCDHVPALTQVPSYVAIGMWFVFQLISGLGMLGGGSQAGGLRTRSRWWFCRGAAVGSVFAIGCRRVVMSY